MGPLVTCQHLDKARSYVDLGLQEGAKLVVDGRGLRLQGYENGFFLGGCLFDLRLSVKARSTLLIRV
jgi:malonate-semialdehyde dehydrogenase (acetylating)/methylmalonate-semialdehyde dehydrogenase